jgi:DNA-binding NtrC family response regulator
MAKATVLIVEDEPLLRMLAANYLDDAGFETIEAADADEAVQILELGTDISVMFTDIDMPGSMNGLALAAAVRDRWPPVGIIVTSGKGEVRPGELPARSEFFSKPHNWSQLISAVGRVSG